MVLINVSKVDLYYSKMFILANGGLDFNNHFAKGFNIYIISHKIFS